MPGNGNGHDGVADKRQDEIESGGPTKALRQEVADALDTLMKLSNAQSEYVDKVATLVTAMMENVIGEIALLHKRMDALEAERRHGPGRDEGGAGAGLN